MNKAAANIRCRPRVFNKARHAFADADGESTRNRELTELARNAHLPVTTMQSSGVTVMQ
jgi:hypothetical protein